MQNENNKITNRSGSEDATIVLVTQVLVIFSGILTLSMLAWFLAPAGRGAYAVCNLFAVLMGVIFTFGTDRASQYFVMSGKIDVSSGVWASVLFVVLGSFVGMVVGLFLIKSDISFFQKAGTSSFLLSLLLIPLYSMVTALQLHLSGLKHFKTVAKITCIQGVVSVFFIVIFVWHFNGGVNGALWAMILSSIISVMLFTNSLFSNCGLTFLIPKIAHYKMIVSYGLRYYMARLGQVVDIQLGTVLLAFYATREEIGLFTAASALTLKVLLFSTSIETSILPRIVSSQDKKNELLEYGVRVSGLFTAICISMVVVFSVPLVNILLSNEFIDAVPLIWIIAPGIIANGVSKIFIAYFRGINRPGVCSITIWSSLTTNAVVFVTLYPSIGLPAAAWAMTAGYFVRLFAVFIVYANLTGTSFAHVMRYRKDDFVKIYSICIKIRNRIFLK